MKDKWHDIVFNIQHKLDPPHFLLRCINERIRERHEVWKGIISVSFGENLPCIWKDFIEKNKFLSITNPEILPLVGLYEIVNIKEKAKPVVITMLTFDPVNLSASIDLLCSDNEFSEKRPYLSGRLVYQLFEKLVEIFLKLKPIYVSMMVLVENKGLNSVIKKFSFQRQGFLPDYLLIQSNEFLRRKGVIIWYNSYL